MPTPSYAYDGMVFYKISNYHGIWLTQMKTLLSIVVICLKQQVYTNRREGMSHSHNTLYKRSA